MCNSQIIIKQPYLYKGIIILIIHIMNTQLMNSYNCNKIVYNKSFFHILLNLHISSCSKFALMNRPNLLMVRKAISLEHIDCKISYINTLLDSYFFKKVA